MTCIDDFIEDVLSLYFENDATVDDEMFKSIYNKLIYDTELKMSLYQLIQKRTDEICDNTK